ncbi:MAG: nuclear transport factor 2 family protein [Burkholderiales bacterium]|nr:nuclear transport factor 2 family protein [Burkholderiales bacterium]
MSAPLTLDAVVAWFETLSPESLARIGSIYAPDARFKDPFNDVRGTEAIRRVFAHMFVQVADPRFRVTERWQHERGALLLWDFTFRSRGATHTVRGASHLGFASDGRIAWHRDYWDPAEELYEKVPVLGALVRALKRRLAA